MSGHAIIKWAWEYSEGDFYSFAPDDLRLEVSWEWDGLLGGYAWQIDRIGQMDKFPGSIHWLDDNHPVIRAIVEDIEQHDKGLDDHVQYLAREQREEAA